MICITDDTKRVNLDTKRLNFDGKRSSLDIKRYLLYIKDEQVCTALGVFEITAFYHFGPVPLVGM